MHGTRCQRSLPSPQPCANGGIANTPHPSYTLAPVSSFYMLAPMEDFRNWFYCIKKPPAFITDGLMIFNLLPDRRQAANIFLPKTLIILICYVLQGTRIANTLYPPYTLSPVSSFYMLAPMEGKTPFFSFIQ